MNTEGRSFLGRVDMVASHGVRNHYGANSLAASIYLLKQDVARVSLAAAEHSEWREVGQLRARPRSRWQPGSCGICEEHMVLHASVILVSWTPGGPRGAGVRFSLERGSPFQLRLSWKCLMQTRLSHHLRPLPEIKSNVRFFPTCIAWPFGIELFLDSCSSWHPSSFASRRAVGVPVWPLAQNQAQ
jgi:hypothetical protein